ncbi:hypothetical protein ACIB24_08230 [Spongisporangium articulatum]|uniref:Integral membrane protein n=1 Tax=Spongisporangium articulatum TaxID=3362603 RepID=A0ABW8AN75_9ACTN
MPTTTSPGSAATSATTPASAALALRRLYLARSVFAIVWAAVTLSLAGDLNPLVTTLLVIYPLVDVAAAVLDLRAGRKAASPVLLRLNIAVSTAAAAGLAFAGASGVPAVLRVWGAWAVAAGLLQLIVGVKRRGMGGQWPMIISGGLSVLAGLSFVAAASAAAPKLGTAVAYAVPGAIFFLVAAVRLGRATKDRPGT